MTQKIAFSPVTRISGLLSVDLHVDQTGRIFEANIIGEQFRGFESMLKGRRITDAVYFTERICGICSMAHGYTAAKLNEKIYGIQPAPELILLQQAMLGAEFLQNHIRHFYLLALPDYLNSSIFPDSFNITASPYQESRFTEQQQRLLVKHYFQAMEYSRKCHEMMSVFGGKAPHQHGLTAEGVAVPPTADRRLQFLSLLGEVRDFIDQIMLPDVYLLAKVYPDYFSIGARPRRFISFGLFDPNLGGHIPAAIISDGRRFEVKPEEIEESITFAWYEKTDSQIRPVPGKPGAYTWVKAPRYLGLALEGGPLARKIIRAGRSNSRLASTGVMARLVARVEEAALISSWIEEWVKSLPSGGRYLHPLEKPIQLQAVQTNDAPRGPLLHSATVSGETIDTYNVITPSTWNFSPKDGNGQRGPVEESLVGALADQTDQVQPGRIIRSFGPCLSCATHLIDRDGRFRMGLNIMV